MLPYDSRARGPLHAITPRAGAGAGAATAVRTAAGDACARA